MHDRFAHYYKYWTREDYEIKHFSCLLPEVTFTNPATYTLSYNLVNAVKVNTLQCNVPTRSFFVLVLFYESSPIQGKK